MLERHEIARVCPPSSRKHAHDLAGRVSEAPEPQRKQDGLGSHDSAAGHFGPERGARALHVMQRRDAIVNRVQTLLDLKPIGVSRYRCSDSGSASDRVRPSVPRNRSIVQTPAASRCQSAAERRYMPAGMCSRQKAIGLPIIR